MNGRGARHRHAPLRIDSCSAISAECTEIIGDRPRFQLKEISIISSRIARKGDVHFRITKGRLTMELTELGLDRGLEE